MKTIKQRSGLCPQNKDGERFLLNNCPFPSGPRLTGWEEETRGDRGVHVVSLQQTHTHTHTDHKHSPKWRELQEHMRRLWGWGDVGTLMNHHSLITVATALSWPSTLHQNKAHIHTIYTHSQTVTTMSTHTHTHTHTQTTSAHVNMSRFTSKFPLGSCVLDKTSVTLMHHEACVCVCVCVRVFMRGLWLDLCFLRPLTRVYPS